MAIFLGQANLTLDHATQNSLVGTGTNNQNAYANHNYEPLWILTELCTQNLGTQTNE
jgi:hypothetical protein